jgi:hypothetical protein
MVQRLIWVGVRDKGDPEGVLASGLLAVSDAAERCTVCAILGRQCRGPHTRGPFRFCDTDIQLVIAIEKEVAPRTYHNA